MDTIEIFDKNAAHSIAKLNIEFYPIPPIDSMIYVEGKYYVARRIIYDIDERRIRVMVIRC